MKRNSFDNARGYNLIEAAIVLGIAGLVIGAIFAAAAAVSSENKSHRQQDQITVILNQIRSTYGNRAQLDSATGQVFTEALIDAGLIPENWTRTVNGTRQVDNAYGGSLLVTPTALTGGANDAMNIVLTNVGQGDCYKIANVLLNVGRGQGMNKIDSTDITDTTTFGGIKTSICQSQTVTFRYALKTGS